MKEPHVQISIAKQFSTENITDNYLEVCTFVQTYQATSTLLYSEKTLIEEAYEEGIITEVEFSELSESINEKLKQLRDTPDPKPPSLQEMLLTCSLLQVLSTEETAHLMQVVREESVKKHTILFRISSELKGAYVVLKGRVRETGSGYE